MISHEKALELYGAYFRNELGRDTVREFHAHINDCEDCKVRLRTMKAATAGAGFIRGGGKNGDDKYKETIQKNRTIMFAVLAVLIAFFIMFVLKRA